MVYLSTSVLVVFKKHSFYMCYHGINIDVLLSFQHNTYKNFKVNHANYFATFVSLGFTYH